MSTRREQQDAVDKIVLQMLVKGRVHWSDLEKKVMAICKPFITYSRFRGRVRYLLKSNNVRRVARGIYEITEKGRKYMEGL